MPRYAKKVPANVILHESWETVDPAAWDALVGAGSPFLEHGWMGGLEATGAACPATGWSPRPVTVRIDGRLVAGVPAWIADHDRGQFVYQGHWARAASEAGLDIQPKVVVGVPFTPVGGGRMLIAPGSDTPAVRQACLAGLMKVAEAAKGIHVLFPGEDEVEAWRKAGFFARKQYQFHWHNDGYPDYDAFLARFRSKRRKAIRRERRAVADLDISIIEAPGAQVLGELWQAYDATVRRYGDTDRFLTEGFFQHLGDRFAQRLVAVVARDQGQFVGGALNVRKADRLYGRYWGQISDRRFLHFELCYHQGIEHCIRRGIRWYEPGHGGEHKYARGFEPAVTWSAHTFAHRGVQRSFARAAEREAAWMDDRVGTLRDESPLKPR